MPPERRQQIREGSMIRWERHEVSIFVGWGAKSRLEGQISRKPTAAAGLLVGVGPTANCCDQAFLRSILATMVKGANRSRTS